MHLIGAQEERISIKVPTQGSVRNSEIRKNLFIEFVFTQQQFMRAREKRAGFRALDDAMIVSVADGYDFADA